MERRKVIKALLTLGIFGAVSGLPLLVAAKPGRPASPNSVAGVARRTRRRRRRRVHRNMQLASLPYGCSVTRVSSGVTYYYCGGIWYLPSYSGTTVVYIVHVIESGANTDVEFEEYG